MFREPWRRETFRVAWRSLARRRSWTARQKNNSNGAPTKPNKAKKPDEAAYKCSRPVYMRGEWQDADIWEMEKLVPGNEIGGLAVIEASNTTLLVPPEWHVRIDEHDIYWITRKDS